MPDEEEDGGKSDDHGQADDWSGSREKAPTPAVQEEMERILEALKEGPKRGPELFPEGRSGTVNRAVRQLKDRRRIRNTKQGYVRMDFNAVCPCCEAVLPKGEIRCDTPGCPSPYLKNYCETCDTQFSIVPYPPEKVPEEKREVVFPPWWYDAEEWERFDEREVRRAPYDERFWKCPRCGTFNHLLERISLEDGRVNLWGNARVPKFDLSDLPVGDGHEADDLWELSGVDKPPGIEQSERPDWVDDEMDDDGTERADE